MYLQLLHQALGLLRSRGRQRLQKKVALLLGAGAQGQQRGVGAGARRGTVGRRQVGLECVKRCGGVAIVQDPQEAEYPSMPETALRNMDVDYVVSLALMGALLVEMTQDTVSNHTVRGTIPVDLKHEATIAERVVGTVEEVSQIGHLVPITCPSCGGNLRELNENKVLRYRCHTSHAFTAAALLRHSQQTLEESLLVALRMLKERKSLLGGMVARGDGHYSVQQEERISEIRKYINRLCEFLLNGGDGSYGAAGTVPEGLTGPRH